MEIVLFWILVEYRYYEIGLNNMAKSTSGYLYT